MRWEFLSVVQCNPMLCIGAFNNRQDDASTKFYGKTLKKEVSSKYSIHVIILSSVFALVLSFCGPLVYFST